MFQIRNLGFFIEGTLLGVIKSGIYLLLLAPFVIAPFFYLPHVVGMGFFLFALIEIVFFVYLILAVVFPRYRPQMNLLSGLLLLFLAVVTLSSAQGLDMFGSFWGNFFRLDGILSWIHMTALLLILNSIPIRKEEWKRILLISFFVGSVLSIMVCAEKIYGSPIVSPNSYRGLTFGNATFLASYLIFDIFFGIYLFTQTSSRWLRLFYSFFILLITFSIYLVIAKAAFLAVFGGFLFLLGIFFLFRKRERIFQYLGIGLLTLLFLSSVFLVYSFFHNGGMVNAYFHEKQGARMIVWQIAWDAFKERPLLGWGMGNFLDVYVLHFNPQMMRYENEVWFDRPHNIVLERLVDSGIVGLIAYLLLFIIPCVLLVRKGLREKDFWLPAVMVTLFLAYFVQNLAAFDMPMNKVMFMFLLAFVVFYVFERKEKHGMEENMSANASKLQVLLCVVAVPAILAALFFSLKGVIFQSVLANLSLFRCTVGTEYGVFFRTNECAMAAKQSPIHRYISRDLQGKFVYELALMSPPSSDLLRLINIAIAETKVNISEQPVPFWSTVLLGMLQTHAARMDYSFYPIVEESFKKAQSLSPRHQYGYLKLGEFYYHYQKYDQAVEQLQKAIDLAPEIATSHWYLALTSLARQDSPKAIEELNAAVDGGFVYWRNLVNLQEYATILNSIKDYDRIVKGYEKAIADSRSATDEALFRGALTSLYFDLGEYEKAKVEALKTKELDASLTEHADSYLYFIEKKEKEKAEEGEKVL